MDIGELILSGTALWSPVTFAVLVGVATIFAWLAFAPARAGRDVEDRIDGYLDRLDVTEVEVMSQSFSRRALLPVLRRLLGALGRLAPKRNVEGTQLMLLQAGEPGGLSALDFYGLRWLAALVLGGGYFLLFGRDVGMILALRNALAIALGGFFLPWLWLRRRVRKRKNEIARALPDALDMMTIGVEAGLAFETALVKVGERWDNALTRELQRAVVEMRVGTPRNEALQRMADRAGVQDLSTFVAVLVQSHKMGVSIAQVLHAQAVQMRQRRRQRAEELARQASVKMVFPLVFLIFPAVMVVLLGPSLPVFAEFLENVAPTIGGSGAGGAIQQGLGGP
jgi:tight adherence protein C